MKNYLDLIKEYFSIIVAIPPFLGAIWQLLKLAQISFSYIRFFSVTQLIADGIIILSSLLMISFSTIMLNFAVDKKAKENNTDEKIDNLIDVKKPNWVYGSIFIIIGFVSTLMIIVVNDYFIKNLDTFLTIWIVIPVNTIIYFLIPIIFLRGTTHIKSIDANFSKKLKIMFSIFLFFISLEVLNNYWQKFNQLMLFPNNLINQAKIEKNIVEEFPKQKVKLLYNNDKYLFYSVVDTINKEERIKIVPFEKLFNE